MDRSNKHRRHRRSFSYSHCIDENSDPPTIVFPTLSDWVPEKRSLGTVRYFDTERSQYKLGLLCEDGVSISAGDGVFSSVEGWLLHSTCYEPKLKAASESPCFSPVSSHKLSSLGLDQLDSTEHESLHESNNNISSGEIQMEDRHLCNPLTPNSPSSTRKGRIIVDLLASHGENSKGDTTME